MSAKQLDKEFCILTLDLRLGPAGVRNTLFLSAFVDGVLEQASGYARVATPETRRA